MDPRPLPSEVGINGRGRQKAVIPSARPTARGAVHGLDAAQARRYAGSQIQSRPGNLASGKVRDRRSVTYARRPRASDGPDVCGRAWQVHPVIAQWQSGANVLHEERKFVFLIRFVVHRAAGALEVDSVGRG